LLLSTGAALHEEFRNRSDNAPWSGIAYFNGLPTTRVQRRKCLFEGEYKASVGDHQAYIERRRDVGVQAKNSNVDELCRGRGGTAFRTCRRMTVVQDDTYGSFTRNFGTNIYTDMAGMVFAQLIPTD
jgi:hypothetical protein